MVLAFVTERSKVVLFVVILCTCLCKTAVQAIECSCSGSVDCTVKACGGTSDPVTELCTLDKEIAKWFVYIITCLSYCMSSCMFVYFQCTEESSS